MGRIIPTVAKRVKATPFGVVSVLFQRSSYYGAFTLDPLDVGVGCKVGIAFLVVSSRRCLSQVQMYLYIYILHKLYLLKFIHIS